MMQLYYLPGACSLADHITLEWVGADYALVPMTPETLNTGGNVPLLRHGDFVLTENVAILQYLAELYPDADLLGGDAPRERIRGHLERLEQRLEGGDWIADRRSVADPYLFVIFRWAVAMSVELRGMPNLIGFARRIYGDAGVRAALFAEEGIVI